MCTWARDSYSEESWTDWHGTLDRSTNLENSRRNTSEQTGGNPKNLHTIGYCGVTPRRTEANPAPLPGIAFISQRQARYAPLILRFSTDIPIYICILHMCIHIYECMYIYLYIHSYRPIRLPSKIEKGRSKENFSAALQK